MNSQKLGKNKIGVFTLSMLNVAAVLSIVNFPAQAEYGYQIIFYITISAICFFIPTALVSAELASAWPHNGGLYLWAKEAFGPNWGFVTVFMQWLNSLPWFATVLTFIATALAYMFKPELAENRLFVYIVIVSTMWFCTILNFRGIKLYALLSSAGALIGTVIPATAIVVFAILYLTRGNHAAIPFSGGALLPSLESFKDWMLLAGMMVALAGIDMPAVHVTDVENPRKNFPKAIFLSSGLIIILSIFGSLSISLIVPPSQLSMASGAPAAFDRMFTALGMPWWAVPLMCVMLICGALTTVITWTLGPSKGLLEVAKEGYIPQYWRKMNKHGIPVRILTLQAVIPSIIALVVFFMPTIGGAFWVMMALSAQLYMTMYLFMFASAIKLRFSQPDVPRPYRIPGGKTGMILVAGLGFTTALTALFSGFIPTVGIRHEGMLSSVLYVSFLAGGMIFFIVFALRLCRHQKRKMKRLKQESGTPVFFRSRRTAEGRNSQK